MRRPADYPPHIMILPMLGSVAEGKGLRAYLAGMAPRHAMIRAAWG